MTKRRLKIHLISKAGRQVQTFRSSVGYAISYGKDIIVKPKKFPKRIKSEKKKIEFLEEIISYLELLIIEKRDRPKPTPKETYQKYIDQIWNSEVGPWKFVSKSEIIEEELKNFKPKNRRQLDRFMNRSRFGYFEADVKTRSKIYDKKLKYRVIHSKKQKGYYRELEAHVYLKKPLVFDLWTDTRPAARKYMAFVTPQIEKTVMQLFKWKLKDGSPFKPMIGIIIAVECEVTNEHGDSISQYISNERFFVHSFEKRNFRMVSLTNAEQVLGKDLIGRDRRSMWRNYGMIYGADPTIRIKSFSVQVITKTTFRDSEDLVPAEII